VVPPPRLERGTPGSTNQFVRIFIESQGVEIPMDFDPEEAVDIAEEIRAAAIAAKAVGKKRR